MVTKKRTTDKKTTTKKTTTKKTTTKKTTTREKMAAKRKHLNELFENLVALQTTKDEIKEAITDIKTKIVETGFDESEFVTDSGIRLKRVERPKYTINKIGAVRAMGKDEFIQHASITASKLKKAVGELKFEELVEKEVIKTETPTVYYQRV